VIHPPHGRGRDFAIAAAALVIVVVASVTMERRRRCSARASPYPRSSPARRPRRGDQPAERGRRRLPGRQGTRRGHAEHHADSNALNVTAGLLIPATITGLGPPSADSVLIAVWYLVMTLASLAFAYRDAA